MAQTGYTPILIYSSSTTTNAPAVGNLTNSTLGSELAINITDGKLFYKDNANAIQVIGWKTTPTTAGGTGLTSYTAGDLLYYASGTTLSKLAIGTAYQALQVNAGATAPSWQPSATSVLTTQGDLLYASAANTLARLAKNATATRYLSNTGASNNPAWAQIDLTNGVTGILPSANGGTGVAYFAVSGPTATRTYTFPDSNATIARTDVAQTFNGGTQIFDWAQGVADEKVLRIQNSQGSQLTKADFGFYSSVFGIQARNIAETVNQPLALQPLGGDVRIGNGNLVLSTSGTGIDFSATPGTGTSELLADYEEGTWTATMVPSTSGTITLSNNGGTYTKIGRTVTINAALKVSSVSSPVGYFTINGLPFSGGAGSTFRCSISILGDAMETTMTTSLTASMQSGTVLYVFKYSGTGSQANCAQDVKANSEFFIGGTYTT